MESNHRRGFRRLASIIVHLPSALKIGAVAGGIAIALYLTEQGAIPASPVAVLKEATAEAAEPAPEPTLVVAEARPTDPIADLPTDIDPGDFRLSETGPEPNEAVTDGLPEPEERVVMVRRGDTLLDLLMNAGIARAEAHEAVSALRSVYNPRDLRPGQEIKITLGPLNLGEPPSLLSASFPVTAERDISLSREPDGKFTASRRDKELQSELIRATGVVQTSLFEAASDAGVPGAVMVELIRILSYDVDFQRDVHPGDTFDLVFERFRDEEGRFVKDGDVIYGALTLSGTKEQVYRYVHEDGTVGFYDEKGENVRKALLRTPIDGARLTSSFGRRKHPILGYSAMHKGVDFGAPQDTPIQAAGDGTIEIAGRHGAYGKYVRIRHNSEYASAYAHMSRIARGLRPGVRVRQGQVIGYVGSTGRSTGPHLHYEVIRRGKQINPMAMKLPTARKLEGDDLIRFRLAKAEIDLQVAAIEPVGRIAQAEASDKTGR